MFFGLVRPLLQPLPRLVVFVCLCATGVSAGLPAIGWAARPRQPASVVVPSFEDQRSAGGQENWLGRFLREHTFKTLLRRSRLAAVGGETADFWKHRFAWRSQHPPTMEQLSELGVEAAVMGITQTVLDISHVRLTVIRSDGAQTHSSFLIRLKSDSPNHALTGLTAELEALLPLDDRAMPPRLPDNWRPVRGLYSLLAEGPVGQGRDARPKFIDNLVHFLSIEELKGRVEEALARLTFEQAMLHHPEGRARNDLLRAALGFLKSALAADPQDTALLALKGEIHFFLMEYFESKTEASITRLRNPLDPLAHVVLALNAGLSTGESNEHMSRALAIAPFLNPADRDENVQPFQSGILDPHLEKWRALKTNRGFIKPGDYRNLIGEGLAYFQNQQWDAAEEKFSAAAQQEENDYTPWLYLARIMIQTGRAAQAIPRLRQLASENPNQAEIHHHLGEALEDLGEFGAARNAFTRSLREDPSSEDSLLHLARIEIAEERWEQALTALRKLLNQNPEHSQAWAHLGQVRVFQNDRKGALDAYARALELDPENEDARRGLARLRKKPKR